MLEIPDHELIVLACNGDEAAAQVLVERYSRPLFGFILRLVGVRETAEDIFQNTFISVFKNLRSYQDVGKFKAWLFRIAHNQVKDYFKKRKIPELELEENMIVREINVLDEMITAEIQAKTLALVDKLPEKQKAVFLLRMEGGLSFKEIAEVLKCPLNTAISQMHYAIKKLKSGMSEDYDQV